jgi:hypothetical protein
MLKNLGCEDGADGRWCNVELTSDGGTLKGWSSASYLKEGAAMAKPAGAAMAKKPAFSIGTLKCEKSNGTPVADCAYGVLRVADGMARLQITWPDASKRLFGIYKSTVTSASGPVTSKEGADGALDISLVPAGAPSEHYLIPADVLAAK